MFFSSGGMKFSMIKYLSERPATRETEREQGGGKEQERKELMPRVTENRWERERRRMAGREGNTEKWEDTQKMETEPPER